MLLSAIDPALLFYTHEDWRDRKAHCFRRFGALALHFRVTREYGQQIAMSSNIEGLIYKHFPWKADFRNVRELRDLRNLVLDRLQRVKRVDTVVAGEVNLQPAGILCKHVEASEVIVAWEELLCACCVEEASAGFDPQIATWETSAIREHDSVKLTVTNPEMGTDVQYELPLVWNDDSWAVQLARQDWWPDLQRCAELEFRTNDGLKHHHMVKKQPIPFKSSKAFMDSLDRFCKDRRLQRSLVEALTKRVYGILDAGLGDEQMGNLRRFRVTRF